jgi:2-methylcitrate dehydratase PrpD
MRQSDERQLIEFANGLEWITLPEDVKSFVTLLVSDSIANAVAGRGADGVAELEMVHETLYGGGNSSVIGGGRTSYVGAAGLNAFQITANTMCDVYRPALCHITPEVIPAALAVAERVEADGASFMTAVAAGLEVTTRICLALNYNSFRKRGWHSPGIAGTMGASVSAGFLEGLDDDGLAGCLGLAGSQASGSFASIGTMAVKFHQLHGAQSAVIASTFAKNGLRGSPRVLTADDGGLLRAFSDDPDSSMLSRELGNRWELLGISMRPYPAASSLQSLINCLLCPSDGRPVNYQDLETVTIELPEEGFRLGAAAGWESELRAMQSARFVAAGVLVTGKFWTDLYSERNRADSRITDLAESKIIVEHDTGLSEGAVRITLDSKNERRIFYRDAPIGDPLCPMTQDEVLQKARRCFDSASLRADWQDISRILELQNVRNVATFLRELQGTE